MNQWLNISCSGKFHYLYYAKYLSKDDLNKIYFSHKCSTTGELPKNRRKNLFVKEYLVGGHLKFLGEKFIITGFYIYNKIWEAMLAYSIEPAKVNIFLLHGNCLKAMKKVKGHGLVVGEAVNSHPDAVWSRLKKEADLLGVEIKYPRHSNSGIKEELNLLDVLLCPSAAVADSFVDEGFSKEKIVILPYGVDFGTKKHKNSCKKIKHLADIKNIVCVGQISVRKGQIKLLDLIKNFCSKYNLILPNITFIGRGDPDYVALLRRHEVKFLIKDHIPHNYLMEQLGTY